MSAFDRYLARRGAHLLGFTNYGHSWKINGLVGVGLLLVGGGVGVIASASGQPDVMYGMVGPAIAGLVNVLIAVALKRKADATKDTAVLSNEARAFLNEHVRRVLGWNHIQKLTQCAIGSAPLPTSISATLEPAARDVLDRGAEALNRIEGLWQLLQADPNHPLRPVVGSAREAADETIAILIHEAATLQRYPEARASLQSTCDQRIAELEEIAGRLELLSKDSGAILPVARTGAATLLQELRLQDLARQELRIAIDEEPPTQLDQNR